MPVCPYLPYSGISDADRHLQWIRLRSAGMLIDQHAIARGRYGRMLPPSWRLQLHSLRASMKIPH
jgi:hypothetical protein